MTTFNINADIRNARIAEIETAVRQGGIVETAHGVIQFRDSRFHLNNKRISVGEAREFFAEIAEVEQVNAFEAEQAAIAAAQASFAKAKAEIAAEVTAEQATEYTGEEMTVAEAAQLLNLSPVRIRRMTTEGKIRYGSRGHVVTSDVMAELNRRNAK